MLIQKIILPNTKVLLIITSDSLGQWNYQSWPTAPSFPFGKDREWQPVDSRILEKTGIPKSSLITSLEV